MGLGLRRWARGRWVWRVCGRFGGMCVRVLCLHHPPGEDFLVYCFEMNCNCILHQQG